MSVFKWIKGVWGYSKREEELLEALAWMAVQYLEHKRDDGVEALYHSFMSAGELTCAVLDTHGLIVDDGSGGEWTEKGKKFLADH